jgi:hypothetical protein
MLYVVGLFVSCAANSSVEVGSGWPKRSWLLGFLIGFGRASSKERRELRGIAGLGSEGRVASRNPICQCLRLSFMPCEVSLLAHLRCNVTVSIAMWWKKFFGRR